MAAAPSATAESQGYGASGGAISGSENKQTISLLDIMKARAAKPQTPRPEMKAIRVSVDLLTIAVKTGELMLVRDFNVRMLDANTRVALVMLMGPQKSNTGKPVPVPVIGSANFVGNVPLGAEDFQKHRNIHGLSEDYTTTKSSFTRDLVGWHFSGFSLSDSGVVFVPCIAGTKAGLRAEISFGKFAMDQGFILAFTIYV